MLIKEMNLFMFLCVIVFCATITSSVYTQGPNRIINGSPATENQFPYMISLQRLSDIHSITRGHKCGGVLITLQHALTAAMCILEVDDGRMTPINRDEYRVFAGSVLLTNDTSADRIRRIANTTIHPSFDTNPSLPTLQLINDIGVIILGTSFSENTVSILSVTDIGTTETVPCTLSGWGMQSPSATTANTQLMYAQILAIDQSLCRLLVGASLESTKLCAWAPNLGIIQGAAGCTDDKGGPLVCQGGLAGILIETSDCLTVPSRPQLYTRVSNYTTWINTVIPQPIPELGPEPSTVPPPTTLPTTTAPVPTPDAASTFQPAIILLIVVAIAQIVTANIIIF